MIINASVMQGLYRSFNTIFKDAATQALAKSMWELVAMRTGSTGKSTDYPNLGALPQMREWLGERVLKDMAAGGFTITNKDFETTVAVDRNSIEDDQLGVYTPYFADLGATAIRHRDILVFGLLASGFNTLCWDGQYFFDTDHPVGDGVVSNSGGGGGTPWFLLDLSRPLKPLILQVRKEPQFVAKDQVTDDNVFFRKQYAYGVDDRKNVGYGLWQLAYGSKQTLDATGYAAARAAMGSFKNENGEPMGITGTHLVVPQSLEGPARKILKNSANGDNEWFGTAELLVVPWL